MLESMIEKLAADTWPEASGPSANAVLDGARRR